MSLIKRMSPDEKKESGVIALCLMLLIIAHFIPKNITIVLYIVTYIISAYPILKEAIVNPHSQKGWMAMITNLKLKAYGKINLALDVLRKREDGYHDVRMIMQTVGIYDQVDLRRKEEPGITVETNLSYLPVNENNLVYQAARLLMEEFQVKEGLHIQLKKFLPVAAGMAGGSSDAAAVLYGVNKMFGLGLSKEALMERGVKIGADVPYCLLRGTARIFDSSFFALVQETLYLSHFRLIFLSNLCLLYCVLYRTVL